MRVIGKDNRHVRNITCRNCASVIEYTESEVRNLWSGKDYSGGSDGADGFNCPCCGAEVHTRRW